VIAGCVGPACADAARAHGIDDPTAPDVGRLGLMVRTLGDRLESRRVSVTLAGRAVTVQGRVVDTGGMRLRLTEREHDLFRRLLREPGVVVSRRELLRAAWTSDGDPHVVEVAVARLRRKLGPVGPAGIVTVPRRGYRLVP